MKQILISLATIILVVTILAMGIVMYVPDASDPRLTLAASLLAALGQILSASAVLLAIRSLIQQEKALSASEQASRQTEQSWKETLNALREANELSAQAFLVMVLERAEELDPETLDQTIKSTREWLGSRSTRRVQHKGSTS